MRLNEFLDSTCMSHINFGGDCCDKGELITAFSAILQPAVGLFNIFLISNCF